jgi:hypothetical protein
VLGDLRGIVHHPTSPQRYPSTHTARCRTRESNSTATVAPRSPSALAFALTRAPARTAAIWNPTAPMTQRPHLPRGLCVGSVAWPSPCSRRGGRRGGCQAGVMSRLISNTSSSRRSAHPAYTGSRVWRTTWSGRCDSARQLGGAGGLIRPPRILRRHQRDRPNRRQRRTRRRRPRRHDLPHSSPIDTRGGKLTLIATAWTAALARSSRRCAEVTVQRSARRLAGDIVQSLVPRQ